MYAISSIIENVAMIYTGKFSTPYFNPILYDDWHLDSAQMIEHFR